MNSAEFVEAVSNDDNLLAGLVIKQLLLADEKIGWLIEGKQWDYVVYCDGSGTVLGSPAGCHCVIYDMKRKTILELTSGYSSGTNNFAELNAFVMAFWQIQQMNPFPLSLLCISDSELTIKCARNEYSRNSNRILWAAIDQFVSSQTQVDWIHRPRNSNAVMQHCDKKAGEARRLFLSNEDK